MTYTEVDFIREGEDALAQAEQLLKQRRLPEAVDLLSRRLAEHPDDVVDLSEQPPAKRYGVLRLSEQEGAFSVYHVELLRE